MIGLHARENDGNSALHSFLLNEYAAMLLEKPDVTRLVINLVQPPPDFLPPPQRPATIRPYDAILAVWSETTPPIGQDLRGHVVRADTYEVEEIREKNDLPERSGSLTPGIKNLPLVTFKDSLSPAEGLARWEAHAALGRRMHVGMKRYVRNVVTGRSTGAPPIHGIAENSFKTMDDLRFGLFPTAEDRAAFLADVAGFVAGNVTHYATEHVIKW